MARKAGISVVYRPTMGRSPRVQIALKEAGAPKRRIG
jgi:hypothetical protein